MLHFALWALLISNQPNNPAAWLHLKDFQDYALCKSLADKYNLTPSAPGYLVCQPINWKPSRPI